MVTAVSAGVKKIVRQPGVEDEHEAEAKEIGTRNIDHISDETIDQMYSTRLTDEQKTEL